MPGGPFRPSMHGCEFGNAEVVGRPIKLGPIPIARVIGGLCGGMVLDSLYRWQIGAAPAGRSSHDLAGVFAAQLRSFQVPTAPLRYLRLQQPGAVTARRTASDRAREQLVRQLRAGDPVPLALICRLSINPLAVSAHHVVLAYDVCSDAPREATFAIYDPNHPGDDTVRLRIADGRIAHSHRRGVAAGFVLHAR